VPDGQPHDAGSPVLQTWVGVHTVPHPPQLNSSPPEFGYTQYPEQFVSRKSQPFPQLELLHSALLPEQTVVQLPQCPGLFVMSTQVPLQFVFPAGHVHAPATHTWLFAHAVAHVPQWVRSFCES